MSESTVTVETASDWSGALGEVVTADIDGIGRIHLRLLTPTVSGYETVLTEPGPAALVRIRETVDALARTYEPYIARVQRVAEQVRTVLETEVRSGRLAMDDLFDAQYRREGTCEPPQYLNRAVAPFETLTRRLLEAELLAEPRPDFCILLDHNLIYSQPPRADDRLWNLRNSRRRRIFDDKVGMAASRNLKPFLVQSYARDLGARIETLMEFDAPVFIEQRHWGTVRMAYQLR